VKTWKTKKTVCRACKSGRFARKGKCSAYKRSKVKNAWRPTLFHSPGLNANSDAVELGTPPAMKQARMSTALLVELLTDRPILRRKDLARRYGVSERTIDRMRQDGTLPKPLYLHGPFWRPSDIARAEAADQV
jgi:predicted DNA-binding transcriptional regulator AlpA